MPVILENGTGVLGANSYATAAYFKSYHKDRGTLPDGLSTSAIEILLIRGTDYIENRWFNLFKGIKQFSMLTPRSILLFTGQPVDDEEIVVGDETLIFKDTPVLENHIQIGPTLYSTIANLACNVFTGFSLSVIERTQVVFWTMSEGVSTTTTVANATFDRASTTGASHEPQPLSFPRAQLRDKFGILVTGIPDNLKKATAEYALRANSVALAPDITVDETGLQRTMLREKVGPVETEVRYASGSPRTIITPYPAADLLLSDYMLNTSGVIRA